MYIEFNMTPQVALVAKERIVDIHSCRCDNKLKLNEDTTELIVTTHSRQSKKVNIESVQVRDCDIKPAHSTGNLCATFDDHKTIQPHQ